MNRWAVVIAAVLIAAIAAGIAYNIGVQQGIAHSGKLVAPAAGPYPYPYYWHPWAFGFGFFPIFPIFFFIALWFVLFRVIFWRGGWHRYGYGCGPYPREREDNPDRR